MFLYILQRKFKCFRTKRKRYKYGIVWPTKNISKKKAKLLQKNKRKYMIELGRIIRKKIKIKVLKKLKGKKA
jgi:hypothetical protein